MRVHAYAPILPKTWRIVRADASAIARARARTVPVLRHEFVWSFRGAQMPRSAALQMFEQKFRPFTILRCDGASRTTSMGERGGKGEKADPGGGRRRGEGYERLKRPGQTKTDGATERDETVCNKIVRGENCVGYRDYKIGRALMHICVDARKLDHDSMKG